MKYHKLSLKLDLVLLTLSEQAILVAFKGTFTVNVNQVTLCSGYHIDDRREAIVTLSVQSVLTTNNTSTAVSC